MNIPKIGDHYGTAASDRSSSIDPYSDGRMCDDIESFDYAIMPAATTTVSDNSNNYPMSAASSSNIIHGSTSSPMNNTCSDSRWMQYLSDEAFSFNNNNNHNFPSSFPNHCNVPYPPSKVILNNLFIFFFFISYL